MLAFTLHRYIFRELLRVFVLSALALTVMLSIGSILAPVQEYGVGPKQVIHLMGYFMPITLTFVLPMAALFSCALVYGRFAGDNELDACRASGISLLTLVYPGMTLAIIVAIANLILSFHVMPAFVKRAEKSVKADAKQILFRNIERQGYYQLPGGASLIYADVVDPKTNMLGGVVIAEVKSTGVSRVITAEKAKVEFDPHERFNEVQITAYNTYKMATDTEGGFSAKWLSISKEFAALMADDVKFKNIEEMKEIRKDAMTFDPVARLARGVFAQYMTDLLAKDIEDRMAGQKRLFYDLISEPNSVKFSAKEVAVEGEESVTLLGDVVVMQYVTDTGKAIRALKSQKAVLRIEGDKLAPTLTMEVFSPTWQKADGSEGVARQQIIRGLIPPSTVMSKLNTADVLQAIDSDSMAQQLGGTVGGRLGSLKSQLDKELTRTMVKITAEIHSRLVFGVGCVGMIMIAIGLGVKLKGGHLLTAFGASSIPAGLLIVGIMAGKNIAKNPGSDMDHGLMLMWGALAALYILMLVLYRKLLKN